MTSTERLKQQHNPRHVSALDQRPLPSRRSATSEKRGPAAPRCLQGLGRHLGVLWAAILVRIQQGLAGRGGRRRAVRPLERARTSCVEFQRLCCLNVLFSVSGFVSNCFGCHVFVSVVLNQSLGIPTTNTEEVLTAEAAFRVRGCAVGMQQCSDGESTGTGRDDATHTARDFATRTQQEATTAQTASEATAKVENRSVVWLPQCQSVPHLRAALTAHLRCCFSRASLSTMVRGRSTGTPSTSRQCSDRDSRRIMSGKVWFFYSKHPIA